MINFHQLIETWHEKSVALKKSLTGLRQKDRLQSFSLEIINIQFWEVSHVKAFSFAAAKENPIEWNCDTHNISFV